jgi:endonuclease YncB( thermonuclease family)
LSAIALLVAEAAAAATWQGRVSAVHDGDTLTVQRRAGSVLVRLVHIDAPESDQPFGLESRRGLQRLVRLEEVRVTTAGRDRYGRTLGTVTRTRDGLNVNLAQVEHGFAWAYARGSAGLAFDRAERAARAARRGLWADPSPVRPSEWRRRRRGASTRR